MSTGPVAWPVANGTAAALLGPGVVVDSVGRNYLWVVIVGGVLAFGMVRNRMSYVGDSQTWGGGGGVRDSSTGGPPRGSPQ